MFDWFKNLFGGKNSEPLILTNPVVNTAKIETTEVTELLSNPVVEDNNESVDEEKKQPKESSTKKLEEVDLSSMKKNELLAYAKKAGVKANSSMKKDDIIASIKKES